MPEINEPARDKTTPGDTPAEEPKVLSLQETPTEEGEAEDVLAHGSSVSLAACAVQSGG